MKWDCGPTWQERQAALKEWHVWFAWYPVRLGSHECRWLETIERKGEWMWDSGGGGWTWEYRAMSTC